MSGLRSVLRTHQGRKARPELWGEAHGLGALFRLRRVLLSSEGTALTEASCRFLAAYVDAHTELKGTPNWDGMREADREALMGMDTELCPGGLTFATCLDEEHLAATRAEAARKERKRRRAAAAARAAGDDAEAARLSAKPRFVRCVHRGLALSTEEMRAAVWLLIKGGATATLAPRTPPARQPGQSKREHKAAVVAAAAEPPKTVKLGPGALLGGGFAVPGGRKPRFPYSSALLAPGAECLVLSREGATAVFAEARAARMAARTFIRPGPVRYKQGGDRHRARGQKDGFLTLRESLKANLMTDVVRHEMHTREDEERDAPFFYTAAPLSDSDSEGEEVGGGQARGSPGDRNAGLGGLPPSPPPRGGGPLSPVRKRATGGGLLGDEEGPFVIPKSLLPPGLQRALLPPLSTGSGFGDGLADVAEVGHAFSAGSALPHHPYGLQELSAFDAATADRPHQLNLLPEQRAGVFAIDGDTPGLGGAERPEMLDMEALMFRVMMA